MLAEKLSWDLAWWTLPSGKFEEAKENDTSLSYPLGTRALSSCVQTHCWVSDHQRSSAQIWVAGITSLLGHYNIQLWLCA